MTPPSSRAPFRLLWSAALTGDVGQWLLQIALPVLVFTRTGSATVTSIVAALGLGSSVLLSPIAGTLADRVSRRWLLAGIATAQATILLPLLITDGQLVVIAMVAAAQGALAGAFETVRTTTVPLVVPSGDLLAANGRIGVAAAVGRLVGGPLGGVAAQFGGTEGIAAGAMICFALAAGAASALPIRDQATRPIDHRSEPPETGTSGSVGRRGAVTRALLREPALRTVAVVLLLISLAQGLFLVLFLVFVTDLLQGSGAEVGTLRGIQAIGGLAAGAVVGVLARRLSPVALLGTGLVTFGVLGAAVWNGPLLSTTFWPYLLGFALIGAPGVWVQAALLTLIQRHSPPAAFGRTAGTLLAMGDTVQALGVLLAGLLADRLPLLALLNAQNAMFLLAAALLVSVRRCYSTSEHSRVRSAQHPV